MLPILVSVGRRHLTLVDGGVYDNLGIDWFVEPRSSVLLEDNLIEETTPTSLSQWTLLDGSNWDRYYGPIRLLFAVIAIQYEQTMSPRVRSFGSEYISNSIRGRGVFVPISSNPRHTRPSR